jgi:predicted secreted protein
MPKRSFAVSFLCAVGFFSLSTGAWAGDSAVFVDLGFSADGRAYMFAQYGLESVGLKPWAELFVVDVPRNDFVAGGVKKTVFSEAAEAGQDGSGAFHRLLAENADLAKKHGVDHLRQGTPLYVSLENGTSAEFRDFDSGAAYKATLVPYVEGSGTALRSSFYIVLERTLKDGTTKKYTVGTPSVKRPLVAAYAIRRVVVAPKDGSLIFVIEMKKNGPKGVDIRYMVEAVRL